MSAELVHELLAASAARDPSRELVVEPKARASYGEIAASSWRLANLLARLGVAPGDRVALLAQNSRLYVEAYYGILAAGAVAVPLNTAADPAMLEKLLADCGARVLIAGPRMLRLVQKAAARLAGVRHLLGNDPARIKDLPPHVTAVDLGEAAAEAATPPAISLEPADRASIIYTSGSTGAPRGVVLTHRNIVANTRAIVAYLGLTPSDRVLQVLPLYYVYGKSLLNTHVAAGGAVVLENRFQYPNIALDTLEAEACTGFSGVPSSFAILLDRSNLGERALPSLRYVTQAGGAMSPALIRRLIEALPRQAIYIMYGATEAAARLAYLPPAELAGAIGSIGRAIPGVELRVERADGAECEVDEVGELVARGPNIMQGYWNAPEETAAALTADGGYKSGDLARRDARGLLYIVGRAKQMIKSGGHRISPQEIEDALAEHEAIREVAVIGVPDALLGELIKAVYVADSELDDKTLAGFLASRLPPYKVPRLYQRIEALPKNESGKVMKQALK